MKNDTQETTETTNADPNAPLVCRVIVDTPKTNPPSAYIGLVVGERISKVYDLSVDNKVELLVQNTANGSVEYVPVENTDRINSPRLSLYVYELKANPDTIVRYGVAAISATNSSVAACLLHGDSRSWHEPPQSWYQVNEVELGMGTQFIGVVSIFSTDFEEGGKL